VSGRTKSGIGLYGVQDDTGNYGYVGGPYYGVFGRGYGESGIGVIGWSSENHGVKGYSGSHHHAAVYGENTDGYGLYGLHTSPSWTAPAVYGKNEGSGAGVLGRSMEDGDGVIGEASKAGGTGVKGVANHNGSVAIHGEGKYGADAGLFEGDVTVKDGEYRKEYSGGLEARTAPAAYGTIYSNGLATTIQSGTGNFSVAWTGSQYEITITGENYNVYTYTTVITPIGSSARMASTNSISGKLIVYLNNLSGNRTYGSFQFVVYRTY
jgi:hypothetical protein